VRCTTAENTPGYWPSTTELHDIWLEIQSETRISALFVNDIAQGVPTCPPVARSSTAYGQLEFCNCVLGHKRTQDSHDCDQVPSGPTTSDSTAFNLVTSVRQR
jgi:hypothetical protein